MTADDASAPLPPPEAVQDMAALVVEYALEHLSVRRPLHDPHRAHRYLSGAEGSSLQSLAMDRVEILAAQLEPLKGHLLPTEGRRPLQGLSLGEFCHGRAAAVFLSQLVHPGTRVHGHDVHAVRRLTDSLLLRNGHEGEHGLWVAAMRTALQSSHGNTLQRVYRHPVIGKRRSPRRGDVRTLMAAIARSGGVVPLPAPDRPFPDGIRASR